MIHTFEPGSRHSYLVELATIMRDAGLSKEDANHIIVSYAREHSDSENRDYIADLVYDGEITKFYIIEGRADHDETEVMALFTGPVGASFDFLREEFERNHPGDVDDFMNWLNDQDGWEMQEFTSTFMADKTPAPIDKKANPRSRQQLLEDDED